MRFCRQSLEQGKKTAKRLQVIKEKMTQALSQQESISQLKQYVAGMHILQNALIVCLQ